MNNWTTQPRIRREKTGPGICIIAEHPVSALRRVSKKAFQAATKVTAVSTTASTASEVMREAFSSAIATDNEATAGSKETSEAKIAWLL